jgi:N-(2-amino-2-carboxyethyl)-L-glutamate synthase
MTMIYHDFMNGVGNTPLVELDNDKLKNINLFIKLEGSNPTGSVKDRAAHYVLNKLIDSHEINKDTMIIESSSGNFGISVACYCKMLNLKCTIVIDPNILSINEYLISSYATKVIKVSKRDETGGFLLTRTRLIADMLSSTDNIYWMNQYSNPYVSEAYCRTLGEEVCDSVQIDYIFLGVSSGGTISGVSRKVKERYPNAKVIAVDVEGSVIFGNPPKKRFIPGIGSSMRPKSLDLAKIDEVVIVNEFETIQTCRSFSKDNCMLIGGSSGSVYVAISKYFKGKEFVKKPNVIALFADRGDRYASTIYNNGWVQSHYPLSIKNKNKKRGKHNAVFE